jgi:hypothetical protein
MKTKIEIKPPLKAGEGIEVLIGNNWVPVGYARNWADVIKEGWAFCYLEGSEVVMSKGGYLNRFRNRKEGSE